MLKIGTKTIGSNVLLAPMAGVTDAPFRRIVASFNDETLMFSEMISSEALVRNNQKTLKMLTSYAKVRAVQIAGSDPRKMAESAKINEDLGADLIDINMGCPAKKIVNNRSGSWLMNDEYLASEIIASVVKSVSIPVTLKMRLGWSDANKNASELAHVAEDLGVKMITIHGRTKAQMYSGHADWKEIGEIKKTVKTIPVICNGDITSIESALCALSESGCDGVMIGRASIGKPWLLNQVSLAISGRIVPPSPTPEELLSIILRHLKYSIEFYGEDQGIKNFRKHLLAYTKGLPNSTEFRNSALQILDIDHLTQFVREFLIQV